VLGQIIRITGSQRTAPFFIAKQEDSHEPSPRNRHLFQLQLVGAIGRLATERLWFATAIVLGVLLVRSFRLLMASLGHAPAKAEVLLG
jgi:hypothetical protein